MGISLKGILGAVAPVLAAALPGPLGGMARKVIAGVLGVKDSDAEIEKALVAADPDKLLALKAAEQAFAVKMGELGIDLEKIAADDRASARAMQIQVKSKMPGLIAAFVFLAFSVVTGFLIVRSVPAESQNAVMMLLGALVASLNQIVGYYFGSSAGSKQKDAVIGALSQ